MSYVTLRRLSKKCKGSKHVGVEKAPAIEGRGKLAEQIEVEFGPFRPAASRRAECFLVARPTSGDLFICAKDLFVEAKAWRPFEPDARNRRPTDSGAALKMSEVVCLMNLIA